MNEHCSTELKKGTSVRNDSFNKATPASTNYHNSTALSSLIQYELGPISLVAKASYRFQMLVSKPYGHVFTPTASPSHHYKYPSAPSNPSRPLPHRFREELCKTPRSPRPLPQRHLVNTRKILPAQSHEGSRICSRTETCAILNDLWQRLT